MITVSLCANNWTSSSYCNSSFEVYKVYLHFPFFCYCSLFFNLPTCSFFFLLLPWPIHFFSNVFFLFFSFLSFFSTHFPYFLLSYFFFLFMFLLFLFSFLSSFYLRHRRG
ncbi:hypothetical protein Pfo_018620 [Paulownia fortunei]|nr:hypothetical protein Pfo_018620 [Paulownia fortunei]